MPEYSQIQTYIRCNRETFKDNLEQFQLLLNEIGFSDNYILANFNNIEWIEEDNGFVYTECNFKEAVLSYEEFSLNLRPLILGWTPRVSDDTKEWWLEVALLFNTEEIINHYKNPNLKDKVNKIIIGHMMNFSKFFNETGAYFTNEDTDGLPWEALSGIEEYLWAFDIAVIPPKLENIYLNPPKEFRRYVMGDKCIYIRDKFMF